MGAYEGLTKFFPCGLCDLAAKLKYRGDNICILSGDIEELQRSFPETYDNLMSCGHNKDKRTPIRYAQDVVASWLFEDYLVAKFRDLGRKLELAGGDRERKLLPHSRVSSSSDCIYVCNGKRLKVEIMNSYTTFWKTKQCLHLRDHKYAQLCKENGVLLCVDAQNSSFAIIDFTKEPPPAKYIPSHMHYGGKPAYELSLSSVPFYDFKAQSIIDIVV